MRPPLPLICPERARFTKSAAIYLGLLASSRGPMWMADWNRRGFLRQNWSLRSLTLLKPFEGLLLCPHVCDVGQASHGKNYKNRKIASKKLVPISSKHYTQG